MAKLAKLNRHHIEQIAYFMDRLAATPDGDGTLLDQVLLQYGSGISDGNQHLHVNLPVLVAGAIEGGRHLRVAERHRSRTCSSPFSTSSACRPRSWATAPAS